MNIKAYTKKAISSYFTTLVLLFVYALALAVATFIEKYYGTAVAKELIYYSPILFIILSLLVANFVAITIKKGLFKQKRWGLIISHFAFVIILLGALITHIFSVDGILHVREGESNNIVAVQTSDGVESHYLPFSVELVKFHLEYYPGSNSPSSFESELIIHSSDGSSHLKKIFMNNVIDEQGYRLFQTSYDADKMGTVLSVNKDVTGRSVTYIGYTALCIGFVLSLTGRNSRIRTLSRRLSKLKKTYINVILIFALLTISIFANANNNVDNISTSQMRDVVSKYSTNLEHAAAFGEIPIQANNGRITPINTFSSEILRKLHKSDKFETLNSDQFLLSLLTLPDIWIRIPFIKIDNDELASYFGLTKGECAYIEVFDTEGEYKLQNKLDEAYTKISIQRNSFDKDIIKLDEKINIIHQLVFNNQLIDIFPLEGDPNHKWYASGDDLSMFNSKDSMFVGGVMNWYLDEVQASLQSNDWSKPYEILDMITTYQDAKNSTSSYNKKKIRMELKYNKLKVFQTTQVLYLILGGFLVVLGLTSLNNDDKWLKNLRRILSILVFGVFIYHMIGMGMRWYIGGYAPWSNSYETMVYVAWATALAGLLFINRSSIVFALAILFSGIILFVSSLNWMDPQINTLVPVLKSPWLMFHVAVIVAAYGFFGISFLAGITNLVIMAITSKANTNSVTNQIRQLSIVNEMSLTVGLILMTIGTFLGAVWANESWGRYWGWDPKETWALITILVYTMVTHLHLFKKWNNLWLFNLSSVVSFASVLMTFFGVNYFLSGMHSYGHNDSINSIFVYLYGALAIVIVLAILSRKGIEIGPIENKKLKQH